MPVLGAKILEARRLGSRRHMPSYRGWAFPQFQVVEAQVGTLPWESPLSAPSPLM